ncbi:hypothetical protein P3L10_015450 [Capsicum annuum]
MEMGSLICKNLLSSIPMISILMRVLENFDDSFSVFDMDKNGSISAEELQRVIQSLGEDCSLAECRKIISGVDCDGDGMINFEEFKIMMVKGSHLDATIV